MKDLVIYGTGGFSREVVEIIKKINCDKNEWNLIGYLDDNSSKIGEIVNGYKVLGDIDWLSSRDKDLAVVIGIGSPLTKKIIYERLKLFPNLYFPNIIHPNIHISEWNLFGIGNIICEGAILTCNIQFKNFVTVNLNSTIGHDTYIENYCTINPNSSISGNVRLKEGVDFGTSATIIQGITVGEYTIIGAGAVVIKDIPSNCTAVGCPAKPIKSNVITIKGGN